MQYIVSPAAGEVGPPGPAGEPGDDGLSAFEIAELAGFEGTEEEWLASLVGAQGETGPQGPLPWTLIGVYDNGASYNINDAVTYEGGFYYRTGNPLNPGYPPTPGSINESWTPVADRGAEGPAGADGVDGADGAPGADGADGADGLSAYEVAVANGFVGTEVEWLASLVGADGADGAPGETGPQGEPGPIVPLGELTDVRTSYWAYLGPQPTSSGVGAPDPGDGVDFEIYIDTDFDPPQLYQKIDGVWEGPYTVAYTPEDDGYAVGMSPPPISYGPSITTLYVDITSEPYVFYGPHSEVVPTVGNVLTWDGTYWVDETPVDTGATTLDDLTDVVITAPAEFQTLEFDGDNWVNEYASTVVLANNAEATTLTAGTVVYLFGGNGDHATVKRADNASDTTSSKTVGVVAYDILSNEEGPIVVRGYVKNQDLDTGYTEGDVLWLGTAGAYTTVKPVAPEHLVFVGVVVRATSNGIIYVATQNGYELEELHNVLIDDDTIADGDVLTWDGDLSLWVNAPASGGGGGADVLSDFDAPYSYMGVAPAGSATSASVWTITRIDTTGPVVTAIAVDVAWDDRLTETYV